MTNLPVVYVFAGLPGVGKSTVCCILARRTKLFHLRVDAVEVPFAVAGLKFTSQGYQAVKNLAQENVDLGIGSIIDCVNPWPFTRSAFDFPAARVLTVDIYCSDPVLHQIRLTERGIGPTWDEVLAREYVDWTEADHRFDSAGMSPESMVDQLLA